MELIYSKDGVLCCCGSASASDAVDNDGGEATLPPSPSVTEGAADAPSFVGGSDEETSARGSRPGHVAHVDVFDRSSTADGSTLDELRECRSGDVASPASGRRLGRDSDAEGQSKSVRSTPSEGESRDMSGGGCCGRLRARCHRRFEDFSSMKYYLLM